MLNSLLHKYTPLLIVSFILFSVQKVSLSVPPDEGMWLPILLKELNEEDMKKRGFRLSAEDIYSVNKSSMKDAVGRFGGGCTSAIISNEGLLLTNHHCGHSYIQYLSSLQNDYLKNGFWAKNKSEELYCPGLTVTFIVNMEDVTKKVLENTDNISDELQKQAKINQNIANIEKEAVKGTHYKARIFPFYYGAEYYMFITEVFTDVRLVGAPPESIGQFGGDTDNWVWPRHGADFALFRIYANAENKPAQYSPSNVPYKPKYVFPISLQGVQKGDFSMLIGFPGRTYEYLPSQDVEMNVKMTNPAIIRIREERLKIIDLAMRLSDTVRIKYSAKYANISNGYKKTNGQLNGLIRLEAVKRKQELEAQFQAWADQQGEPYKSILPKFATLYSTLSKLNLASTYINEAIFGIEILNYATNFIELEEIAKKENSTDQEFEEAKRKIASGVHVHFKDYEPRVDRKVMSALLQIYYDNTTKAEHPAIFAEIEKKYKNDFVAFSKHVFDKSFMVSESEVNKFLEKVTRKNIQKLVDDPAYQVAKSMWDKFYREIKPEYDKQSAEARRLNKIYIEGLRKMLPQKKFYPDANSTLRVTFGIVTDYEPRDGVRYEWFTTLDGVIEKSKSLNPDYQIPDKLKELHAKKDYGRYAKNGVLYTCYIGTNHTTGGNSGSPALNRDGHIVGINFDRNWEGTMSDIMYDPAKTRNIMVDIRYVLFIIDKYAGAGYLLNEMKIIE
ncbi:MAG: S46 family peptidase [Bacteroidia bacterium]|nr:S46 family peptidase [Bacteroidia bacterium]MDW8346009.1 S46 family peptidase [Bacteroidia bacterium]